jgi:hypothetical protein
MLTVLSTVVRGACLLTALATAGLWSRSYFVADQYLRPFPLARPALVDSRVIATVPGGLVFYERSAFA